MPSAPPEPPSPVMVTMIGTVSAAISRRLRAIASAWPRSSAPIPGKAPGVSTKVKIGNPIGGITFNRLSQFLQHLRVGGLVQQHARGVPDQSEGPLGNQYRADEAHGRIEPVRAEVLPREQCSDGQYGSQGIGQHMQVGAAQVVIVMMVVVFVVVFVVVVMFVRRGHQYPRTHAIDDETHHRDDQGLVEGDGQRVKQPVGTLGDHHQSKAHQQDGTGKARQAVDLSDTEAVLPVIGRTP